MQPEANNGRLIRKRKYKPHKLQDIDPAFGEEYDDVKHGETLRAELKIAHLTPHQRSVLTTII